MSSENELRKVKEISACSGLNKYISESIILWRSRKPTSLKSLLKVLTFMPISLPRLLNSKLTYLFFIIQMTNATELFRRNEKIAAILGYSVNNARTNKVVVLIIQYPTCLGASRVRKHQLKHQLKKLPRNQLRNLPRSQLRKVQSCIVLN